MNIKEKLHYLKAYGLMLFDRERKNQIISLPDDGLHYNEFEFVSRGEDYPEKVFYLIELNLDEAGFYSAYFRMLNRIAIAEKLHAIPVVDVGTKWCYLDGKSPDDPFEWLFEYPIHPFSKEEITNASNIILSRLAHEQMLDKNGLGSIHRNNEHNIQEYGRLSKKYLRIRKDVQNRLKEDIRFISRDFHGMIGVHARESDIKRDLRDTYIKEIDTLLSNGGYTDVFLATEDDGILSEMKMWYGNRLHYYDDSFHVDGYSWNDRVGEGYEKKMIYEAIRDVHALGECEAFIGNLSDVSYGAQVRKKEKDENYRFLKILSEGIYTGA